MDNMPRRHERHVTTLVDPSFMRSPLQIHHHVIALDRNLDGLRNVRTFHDGRARLDGRRIGPRAETFWIAIGLSGADVEFPAMPGAADDLAEFGVFDLAGITGRCEPDQRALAQRCAL